MNRHFRRMDVNVRYRPWHIDVDIDRRNDDEINADTEFHDAAEIRNCAFEIRQIDTECHNSGRDQSFESTVVYGDRNSSRGTEGAHIANSDTS